MTQNKNEELTVKTEFTRENIVPLKNAIKKAVNEYANENFPNGQGDVYLLLSSLGLVAFDVAFQTLSYDKGEKEAELLEEQMRQLVRNYIKTTNETRRDIHMKTATEIMAAAQFLSFISEYYARRRDEAIKILKQEKS